MKTLTVVTPTYNRAKLLRRVYDSLAAQTSRDFVWMIVDDGSSDNTEDLVASFMAEGTVEIDYVKKENGGKHTAMNTAIARAESKLIALTLDSDDVFTPDAVEKILGAQRFGDYSGYIFLKGTSAKTPHVTVYDDSLKVASWQSAVSSGRFEGEAVIVLKTDYAKRFSFPVIENERFFTEGYVWLQMADDFLWSRDVICVGDYLEDGYSKNILSVFAATPKSHMMYNNLRLSLWKSAMKKIKFAAYYDGFAMMAKEKGFIKKASSRFLAFLTLPAGFAFYILLKIKK